MQVIFTCTTNRLVTYMCCYWRHPQRLRGIYFIDYRTFILAVSQLQKNNNNKKNDQSKHAIQTGGGKQRKYGKLARIPPPPPPMSISTHERMNVHMELGCVILMLTVSVTTPGEVIPAPAMLGTMGMDSCVKAYSTH